MPIGCPRMSPTPRSAKYGVTHGANHLPGLEKCPPLVVVSAGGGGVGASLRQTVVPFRANRANRANVANGVSGGAPGFGAS